MRFSIAVCSVLGLIFTTAPVFAKDDCSGVTLPTLASLAVPGPHAVGELTFTFVDTSRPTMANGTYAGAPTRTLVTEVWFPVASPGDSVIDAAHGPYPLIIHSHGFSDSRTGMGYLSSQLASYGYVVAAADFPLSHLGSPGGATVADVVDQPGDDSFVLDQVLALSAGTTGALAGGIDPTRIGANGLSLGGMTTLLLTYHQQLRDPRIKATLAMAPGGCPFTERFYRTVDVPFLVMHGDTDHLLPWRQYGKRPFNLSRAPKYFVRLTNGSHVGFTGFATLFDQTKHLDRIGCVIFSGPNPPILDGALLGPYNTKAAGVVSGTPRRCPAPCTAPFIDPSMSAARQHMLAQITNTAFFDGYLKDDVASRCFLKFGLRGQPDVTVSAH
jgi:predicted dienelactone hydrolase